MQIVHKVSVNFKTENIAPASKPYISLFDFNEIVSIRFIIEYWITSPILIQNIFDQILNYYAIQNIVSV